MELKNEVVIHGHLVQNELELGGSDKGNWAKGWYALDDGAGNRIRVDAFAMQMTKAGGINPAYARLQKLIEEGIVANKEQGLAGTLVRVAGTLEDESYLDAQGVYVELTRINGNFPQIINQLGDKQTMGGKFSFQGFVQAFIPELDNTSAKAPTGRVKVTLANTKYDGRLNPVTLTIPADMATAFQQHVRQNEVAELHGTILNIMNVTTTEVQVAFGTAQPNVTTEIIREFLVSGGNPSIAMQGWGAAEVTTASAARDTFMADRKAQADAARANKANAAAGAQFGPAPPNGQGAAFAGAVANASGGRPTF